MSKKADTKKKIVEEASDNEDSDEITMQVGDTGDFGGQDSQFKQDEQTHRKQVEQGVVHLHFQQRTTRKCLTLVQGLPVDLDLKKIVRSFKKVWCCNGTTHEHEEWGSIIQLQGDHRRDIMKFLIEEGICTKEQIKVHGY